MDKIATSLSILLVLASVEARANLITNGSFETPVVTAGTFQLFGTGSMAIPGWTVTGPEVAVVSGSYSPGAGFTFPAQSGSQWLDLTGLTNTFEGVKQTVSTTTGTDYNLSFYVGNVSGSIWGTTSTVEVQINGVKVAQETNSTASQTLDWQQFTVPFTATGPTTTIELDNLDPANDNSNGLDNVDLEFAGPSTVPEPSSLVLLGAGLIAVASFGRRRIK